MVARNEKWTKQLWVFVYIKYDKFWSISLEHFVEHKLRNCEEWSFIACHDLAPKTIGMVPIHKTCTSKKLFSAKYRLRFYFYLGFPINFFLNVENGIILKTLALLEIVSAQIYIQCKGRIMCKWLKFFGDWKWIMCFE